jgi:predicted alpha/beta hydrolase
MQRIETVQVTCNDGVAIAADIHLCAGTVRARALIAPAMGVKRRLYRSFALALADAGIEVMTLDYRGVGDSLHGSIRRETATLHDWAERDLSAAVAFLSARGSEPIVWIGHSVGGQLMGLIDSRPITCALFVASQSGYWKHWDGAPKAAIFALWHLAIPLFTALTGRLPMRALGQGEDIPKNVAREWAAWGRHPRYIMRYGDTRKHCAFHSYSGPLRAYAISDDKYAPPLSVARLLDFYANTKGELITVKPSDVGSKSLGHFNFFRERYRSTLWKQATDWINQCVA